MRKALTILTLCYYTIGSIILPCSDFSIIPQLPELYAHCQSTEDKDMDMIDFVTDHLLNIDGIFDSHENGDDQKPHKDPVHKINSSFVYTAVPAECKFELSTEISAQKVFNYGNTYFFDFAGSVFRPPMG
ncbi:MAG: hypothetical protein ACXVNM_09410 [Bacteroidia bacterium]